MPETVLQLDPRDHVLVALAPLAAGAIVRFGPTSSASACTVTEAIPAKHKLALVDFKPGELVLMYGMVVGEATAAIPRGGLLSTRNVRHRTGGYTAKGIPFVRTARRLGMDCRTSMATTERTARWEHATTGSCFLSSSAKTATWNA